MNALAEVRAFQARERAKRKAAKLCALDVAARAVLCEIAAEKLREAARLLRIARASNAADYTRRALKSVEGACRHANGRAYRLDY